MRGRRGHFGDLPKRNAGATHLAGAKTKMAEVGMNPLPSGYEYEFISTVLEDHHCLICHLYEKQFKQDVATDSAKNILMKRLEGIKIKAGLLWGLSMKKSTLQVRLNRRVIFACRIEVS